MSRLQVGGLALIIKGGTNDANIGKVVELKEYIGDDFDCESGWRIYYEYGLHMISGEIKKEAIIESYRLLPLGDQQTQDEFRKDAELKGELCATK